MKCFIKCDKPYKSHALMTLTQCFHEIVVFYFVFSVENQFLDYLEKENKNLMSKMIFGTEMNNMAF